RAAASAMLGVPIILVIISLGLGTLILDRVVELKVCNLKLFFKQNSTSPSSDALLSIVAIRFIVRGSILYFWHSLLSPSSIKRQETPF
ncbi:MAG: hypothetical protein RLZZ176_3373, partial [Cyanobacteriota bacterium]